MDGRLDFLVTLTDPILHRTHDIRVRARSEQEAVDIANGEHPGWFLRAVAPLENDQ